MHSLPPMPCAKEYEAEILASILVGPQVLTTAIGLIGPEDFYDSAHAKIYGAMSELFERNAPIDVYTVGNLLKSRKSLEEVGGFPFLIKLQEEVPAALNMAYYCRAVKNKATLRKMAVAGWKIAESACMPGADPVEIRAIADAEITVPEADRDFALFNAGELADEVVEQAFDQHRHKATIYTPWEKLNWTTKGFQPQNLIILAARPGVGKTAMAVNLVESVVEQGKPAAYFSLEMSRQEIIRRIVSARTGFSASDILGGRLPEYNRKAFDAASSFLAKAPLTVDDKGGITVSEIKAKCKRIKAQHGLSLVVVDYLQLMKGPQSDRRDQEIGAITRGLKETAKELDVPVVALSQLNRNNEKENRPPCMRDLRESGSIEQDADIVMFLHPESLQVEPGTPEPPYRPVNLIIGKQRNGPQGIIKMEFEGKTTTYREVKL